MNRRAGKTVLGARLGKYAALASGFAAGLLGVATAVGAPAEKPRGNTFEVTPFVGYMAGGKFEDPSDNSDRDVKEDTNFGVILNMNSGGPDRQYEMLFSQQGTTVEGAQPLDMDIQYLQIGGIVNFTDVNYVVPFFGMTVGATRFAPGADGFDDETKLSFTVGTGFKVPITDHIGVRFDARAFVTLLDTDSDIFCVSTPTTGGACRITAASDTFIQYHAALGLVVAF